MASELRKQSLIMPTPPILYHWRVYSGAECDIVLEYDGKFYPIEIKTKSHPSRSDARGLKAFRSAHPKLPVEKGLIIAPADAMYPVTEDDYVMPWDIA